MVNYLYDPDEIEQNVEAFVGEDRIAATAAIRRLAKTR
jgi:malonyl-CoA decarboxylase